MGRGSDPAVPREASRTGANYLDRVALFEYQRPQVVAVRHARPEDLVPLSGLLASLRGLDGLTERSPGTFYRGSKAFLHFHADPAGLFADLKVAEEFERFRVATVVERRRFLAAARRELGAGS